MMGYLPVVERHGLDHLNAIERTGKPEVVIGVPEVFGPQRHPEDVNVTVWMVRRKGRLPSAHCHFRVPSSGH